MPTTTLTDKSPSETYKGLLHAYGDSIPSIGTIPIYDGEGNKTSIEIGRSGNGAKITGLSATDVILNNIKLPLSGGNQYDVIYQTNDASNATPSQGFASIYTLFSQANIGITYNSYTTNRNTSTISYYNVINGLVRDVAEKNITEISAIAGGITQTKAASSISDTMYVADIDVKGGIVTKVHYKTFATGSASTASNTQRTQVRTFFFDLRLDADTPIEKSTKAGKTYERRAVDEYVQYVWNLEHTTPPINGDIAIVVALKTRENTKAVPAGTGIVRTIKVTESGMKSWGYRWSGTSWVFLGSREIEPGNNPAELTWIDPNYPCEDDVCYEEDDVWPTS